MVLSLVTPSGSDFIKDFPAQNAINCELIDAYAGPCLITHPLQTWSPILTALTANPVLGVASSVKGYYYKIFDQIYCWGEFRFGTSGASFGTGTYLVSLPFPADNPIGTQPNSPGDCPPIGQAITWDNSASNGQPLTVHLQGNSNVTFATKLNTGLGREVNPTTPMTWAVSDGITFAARYKRQP